MKLHLVFDRLTGEIKSQPVPDDAELTSLVHDCPECRASPEAPVVLDGSALHDQAAVEAALTEALARAGIPWRRRSRGRR
jgi:hypothetical protein